LGHHRHGSSRGFLPVSAFAGLTKDHAMAHPIRGTVSLLPPPHGTPTPPEEPLGLHEHPEAFACLIQAPPQPVGAEPTLLMGLELRVLDCRPGSFAQLDS